MKMKMKKKEMRDRKWERKQVRKKGLWESKKGVIDETENDKKLRDVWKKRKWERIWKRWKTNWKKITNKKVEKREVRKWTKKNGKRKKGEEKRKKPYARTQRRSRGQVQWAEPCRGSYIVL